jgi:hypothetical protein
MPEMTEREKLIKELEGRFYLPHEHGVLCVMDIPSVADFILADRQKILAPLVELKASNFDADNEEI